MQTLKKKCCLLLLVFAAFFSTYCDSDSENQSFIGIVKPIVQQQLFSETNHLYVLSDPPGNPYEPSKIYRFDLIKRTKTLLFETGGITDKFVISEDERYVVTKTRYEADYGCSCDKLELYDLVTGTKRDISYSHNSFTHHYPYLIDGETGTLFYRVNNRIHRLNLETGEDTALSGGGNIILLDFHPITKDILVSTGSGGYPSTIQFYTIDWNGNLTSQKSIKGVVEAIRFMPDGDGILGVHDEFIVDRHFTKIVIYDLATNSFQDVTYPGGQIYLPARSADGKYIFYLDQEANDLFVAEVGTQAFAQQTFSNYSRSELPIGFFDNDRQVVFSVVNWSRDSYGDRHVGSFSIYSRFITSPSSK